MVKIRTNEELKGMTVNERQYATDQFDEFDAAVASQDEVSLRQILEHLHIGEASIVAILESEIGRTGS